MNSTVIKFVAGGGKTTYSEQRLQIQKNGLYLSYNKSVAREINDRGHLSRTFDSFFQSFLIPKFTSLIPLITDGAKITFVNAEALPDYLKGIGNIKLDDSGNLYNQSKKLNVNINTFNHVIHDNNFSETNKAILRYIFDREELRLTDSLRSNLSKYLIINYPKEIIKLVSERFSFIIIDEAQDLSDYREDFAKLLFDSPIELIILGDENQNINTKSEWFEKLPASETKNVSYRCPNENCDWIRNNLNIDIIGNNQHSEFRIINYDEVLKHDNGKRTLLYNARSGEENIKVIDAWKGPLTTIKRAKGSTINTDIVIIGKKLKKNLYYTAITRTTKSVYSTIKTIG